MRKLYVHEVYCPDFQYNICNIEEVNQKVTTMYHNMKPTFEELFGSDFNKLFGVYLIEQINMGSMFNIMIVFQIL